MNLLRRNLTIGAIAAVTAGVTWAVASDTVVLYPATITMVVTLPAESVASLTAQIYPASGGNPIQKSAAVPAGSPGPYSLDLVVDGGNPADDGNAGVSYRPEMYVYLNYPSGTSGYLYVQKNTPVVVDNTPASPSAAVTTAFSYPTTYHANASVTVIGGTLSAIQVQSYAGSSQLNESYRSYAYTGFGSPGPATATTWGAMVANSSVTVYATAWVVGADGALSQRSLASQTVNLSQGPADVSWTIDLTNTGNLQGSIDLVEAPASTAAASLYTVIYEGASTTTSGIFGTIQVDAGLPFYAASLTPGDYDVYLRTYLSSPSQYFETRRDRVTVTSGRTLVKDFTNELGVARLALNVKGFFGLADLSSAQSTLRGPQYEYRSTVQQIVDGAFIHTVPAGVWQPYYSYISINRQSTTALPINTQMYKYYYSGSEGSPVTLAGGADVALGERTLTLVRSNLYFDVKEPAGAAAINISSPWIVASRNELDSAGALKSQYVIYANGSSTAQPLSGLTMVAEPGEYTLDARAYVDGTLTRFNGASIKFGQPIDTAAGDDVRVTLTPPQDPELRVGLTFSQVATPGISTVVETALGPAPPEGLRSWCPDNELGVTCDPMYYDIETTATADFQAHPVTVCVRRLVTNVSNAATMFLTLYHYNESNPDPDPEKKWEPLPAPDGWSTPAIDCGSGDPADLAACGCANEASCGIDLAADPQRDVFLVCGVTTSFSPFAILQGKRHFSNEVNGVAYTGPAGPPSLQRWTVPASATYRITATGAQGASSRLAPALVGGCGAEIAGDFALQAGDVIEMLVGQKGTAADTNAGGGGGTFVVKSGAPLVIAGGGGGVRLPATVHGRSGTTSTSGTAGSTTPGYTGGFIAGGTNGGGGARLVGFGAGGGGWFGNGAADSAYGDGGTAFTAPGQGAGGSARGCGEAAPGGYGGGGAGNGCFGAGGGGGYSGGGGGRIGGGGGSLNNGQNPAGSEGVCTPTGHGAVSIDLLR